MDLWFANPTGSASGSQWVRLCVRALTASAIALVLCVADPLVIPTAQAQQNPLLDPNLKANPDTPMLLQADELIYDNKNNKVRAQGNVEVFYNKYTLLADLIIYDRNENVLYAEGNVRIKEPDGAVVKADRIRLTDDFREGFIRSLRIRTSDQASITADRATRTEGNTTIFENGSFTPCKVCEEDPSKPPTWRIKAMKIIHKKDEQVIEYQDMSFEFLGVPIAYVPYFKHPDPTKKRESGFLIPYAYHSEQLGFVAETPYLFALAPNYDVTVTPVTTTRAGQMMKSEWRHRLANGFYKVDLAGAYDDTPQDGLPTDRKLRGSLVTKGNFELGSFWNFGWDATVESDDKFRRFYKLDDVDSTDRASQIYLTGQGERSYMSVRTYQFGGLVVSDDESSNSWVHPIVDYNYILNNPVLGGEVSFNANATSLSRDDAIFDPLLGWQNDWRHVSENSNRVSADIGWRREMIDPLGQVITPFALARGDVYQFSDPELDEDKTYTRGTANAGVEYRYPFIASLGGGAHVIEPIGQVMYRPDTDKLQDRLPNEDAQSLVFDDTLLFDTDKFSGYDRLETGARANVGLRYTFNLPSGGNVRAVVGQSYHLDGDNPFPEASGLETARSDVVSGLYFEPSQHFGLIAQGRFDQGDFSLRRTDMHTWMNYGPFNIAASYIKQVPKLDISSSDPNSLIGEEIAVSAGVALIDNWSLIGNVRYDIEEKFVERHGLGLRYADECFMFGLEYDRTTAVDGNVEPDTTVAVRFEFKHLGGFETKTDVNDLTSNN